MRDFLLVLSDSLAGDEQFLRHFRAQLARAGVQPAISLNLRSSEPLMSSLLWAYEADWTRCIAVTDGESFAALNSALATTLGLDLALLEGEICVAGAKWQGGAVRFFARVGDYAASTEDAAAVRGGGARMAGADGEAYINRYAREGGDGEFAGDAVGEFAGAVGGDFAGDAVGEFAGAVGETTLSGRPQFSQSPGGLSATVDGVGGEFDDAAATETTLSGRPQFSPSPGGLNAASTGSFDSADQPAADDDPVALSRAYPASEGWREFLILRQDAHAAPAPGFFAALECQNRQDAWLLGLDAESARILLGPAAAACCVSLSATEAAPGLCRLCVKSAGFGDVAAFCASAEQLFGERFIAGDLFAALLAKCRARGLKLAAAESCTAGLFAAKFCAHEGASEVFLGGFVPYSRAAKRAWLGVCSLAGAAVYGEFCAEELASGAAGKSGADIAVGITGVLGAGSDEGVARGTVSICAIAGGAAVASGGAGGGGAGSGGGGGGGVGVGRGTSGVRKITERIQLNASREQMQEQAALCAAATCWQLLI